MSVEKQLRHNLLAFPTLFKTKWDVYHHWFIVNGNGYDWVNGELISIEDGEFLTTVEEGLANEQAKLDKKLKKHADTKYESQGVENFNHTFYKKHHEEMINLIKNTDERMVDFTPTRRAIYPLCEYACIMNIPSDIKPDWREAVYEMYKWLVEHDDVMTDSDKRYFNRISFPTLK